MPAVPSTSGAASQNGSSSGLSSHTIILHNLTSSRTLKLLPLPAAALKPGQGSARPTVRAYRRTHVERGAALPIDVDKSEVRSNRWTVKVASLGRGPKASDETAVVTDALNPTTTAGLANASGSGAEPTATLQVRLDRKAKLKRDRVTTAIGQDGSVEALSQKGLRWFPAEALDKERADVWALQSQTIHDAARKTRTTHVLLLSWRDPSTFLSSLPDNTALTSLCLPGTHESLSRFLWPFSSCQAMTSTLTVQLNSGIRFVDLRFRPVGKPGKEKLMAAHGISDQKISADEAFKALFDWLKGPGRRETVFVSLKFEAPGQQGDRSSSLFFELLYRDHVRPNLSQWWLEDRIPSLGEARGKAIMLARFSGDPTEGAGLCPQSWPNNLEGKFSNVLPSGQGVEVQDWYDIGSLSNIPRKLDLVKALMESSGRDPTRLGLNYCSASSLPLALPPVVAMGWCGGMGVNQLLRDFVAGLVAIDNQRPAGKASTLSAGGSSVLQGSTLGGSGPSRLAEKGELNPDRLSSIDTSVAAAAGAGAGASPQDSGWISYLASAGRNLLPSSPTATSATAAAVAALPQPPTRTAVPGTMCIFALDFFDADVARDLVPLLIEANFTSVAPHLLSASDAPPGLKVA